MNFKTKAYIFCVLDLLILSCLDHVLAQQIKEDDKEDEEGKLDNSTLFCIVVVVLVVLAKLFFCACCFVDCNGWINAWRLLIASRRSAPDDNDTRRI